jgi:hypothetical protein
MVRESHMDTLVSTGHQCSSACPLIWMSGEHVSAQYAHTYIYFHQANTAEGTAMAVDYYRNELGLTEQQIAFMMSAPNFTAVRGTAVAARRLGFDFNVVPHLGPLAPPCTVHYCLYWP